MTWRDVSGLPSVDGMPALGLGTWENTDREQCVQSVAAALDMGYHHVDTAQAYGNEEYVGEGIAESGLERDEVFVATKVRTGNLSYHGVLNSTRESLDELGLDYVDLLYVHWPADSYDPEDTLAAFDDLREEGAIDHVGVSNFTPDLLDEAREISDAPVFVNQVEMHPLLQQDELVEYARHHDTDLVAYSPLARGKVFEVPELTEIADKHGVGEAQVSLAWLLGRDNVAAIPKATGVEHIRDNLDAQDLELDEEDVAKIEAIDRTERQVDPDFAPW